MKSLPLFLVESAPTQPVETPLGLAAIPSRTLDEDESTVIPIVVTGSNAEAPLHLSASGLPAGAELDPVARVIRFRPDFIQGGGPASAVTVRARRGAQTAETSFSITVANTIVTPEPAITGLEHSGSCQRLVIAQKTGAYLDSKGHAGRTFWPVVLVPKKAAENNRHPVSIYLHGAGVPPLGKGACDNDSIRIYPHDPNNTYNYRPGKHLSDNDPAHRHFRGDRRCERTN